MNNYKIREKSSVIAIIVCFYAEIIFSSAYRFLYEIAGNSSWICVLTGGMAVTLLLPISMKIKGGIIDILACSLYAVFLIYRLMINLTENFDGGIDLTVLAGSVVLATVAGIYGIKGARILSTLCFLPILIVFSVCCIFGSTEITPEYLTPIVSSGLKGLLLGSLLSFSMFSVILFAAKYFFVENKTQAFVTSALSTLFSSLTILFGTGTFGVTASEYPSIISEIAKNVSLGKFFQRLEGFSDIAYIVSFTVCLTLIAGMISGSCKVFTVKYKKVITVATVFTFACAVSYFAVKDGTLRDIIVWSMMFSGALAVLSVIGKCVKIKSVISVMIAIAILCVLPACASNREIESKTFVVITAYDTKSGDISFITENNSGMDMFSAVTDDLSDAVKSVEFKYNVKLSFDQTEMLLIDENCNCIEKIIKTSIESKMPNSLSLMFISCTAKDLYENLISGYDSAYGFVSDIKSSKKDTPYICNRASRAYTQIREDNIAYTGLLDRDGTVGAVSFNGTSITKKYTAVQTINKQTY